MNFKILRHRIRTGEITALGNKSFLKVKFPAYAYFMKRIFNLFT